GAGFGGDLKNGMPVAGGAVLGPFQVGGTDLRGARQRRSVINHKRLLAVIGDVQDKGSAQPAPGKVDRAIAHADAVDGIPVPGCRQMWAQGDGAVRRAYAQAKKTAQ